MELELDLVLGLENECQNGVWVQRNENKQAEKRFMASEKG